MRCQNNMHSLGEILFAFFTVEKLLKLLFFSNFFIAEYLLIWLSHLIPQNWLAISSDLLVYILWSQPWLFQSVSELYSSLLVHRIVPCFLRFSNCWRNAFRSALNFDAMCSISARSAGSSGKLTLLRASAMSFLMFSTSTSLFSTSLRRARSFILERKSCEWHQTGRPKSFLCSL